MKEIRYRIEYAVLLCLIGFLKLMTPDQGSVFAGKIGRKLGPKLAASRKATANLKAALPGKTDAEYKNIIGGMWENLARVIGEYPNLEFFAPDVELIGIENLKDAFEKHGQVIVFSGHLANWEMMAPCLLRYGLGIDLVYRAPNNPWSDKLLDRYRSLNGKLRTLPKSRAGTRRMVESLQEKRSIGILIDQKYNEGIKAPFFGRPAMTSPAFAQLAQKYDCGLVPFRVERDEHTRFRLSFYPAIAVKTPDGQNRAAEDIIAEAHGLLETWITEKPSEWLWLHRRWVENQPKTAGKNPSRKNPQPRPADPLPPAA